MRFVAFDLETTGTLPGVDRIAEIGAVRMVDGEVDAVFSTLVDPGVPMPEAASRVNKITDDMLRGKPRIEDLLQPFAEFVGDDILVAHNAAFDFGFLSSDYVKHDCGTPSGLVLCSFLLAKKIFPGLANYKLATLVQHLQIPAANFHRAEEDATYCGKLFLAIVERMSGSHLQCPPHQNFIQLTGKNEVRFPKIVPQPKQLNLLDLL